MEDPFKPWHPDCKCVTVLEHIETAFAGNTPERCPVHDPEPAAESILPGMAPRPLSRAEEFLTDAFASHDTTDDGPAAA